MTLDCCVQVTSSILRRSSSWVQAVMMMQSISVGDIAVHMREIIVYVCWGGVLNDGVNGLMTYVGGGKSASRRW